MFQIFCGVSCCIALPKKGTFSLMLKSVLRTWWQNVLHAGVNVWPPKKLPQPLLHKFHHVLIVLQQWTWDFRRTNTCYSVSLYIHWNETKLQHLILHVWGQFLQHTYPEVTRPVNSVLFHYMHCRASKTQMSYMHANAAVLLYLMVTKQLITVKEAPKVFFQTSPT